MKKEGAAKAKSEPEGIKWTPEMSVNEPVIDRQHKDLINETNKLRSGLLNEDEDVLADAREMFHFLYMHVKEHFGYEEGYMEKNNYPRLGRHKLAHKVFIEFFERFKKDFNQKLYTTSESGVPVSEKLKELAKECENFLERWAKWHISTYDKDYANYISKSKSKAKYGRKRGKRS